MMNNTIFLNDGGWDCGCGCPNGCSSGCGCSNGCSSGCGCANGCSNGCGCANGCSNGCGCANGCSNGCGCANCASASGCGCIDDCDWDCGCNPCTRYWPGIPDLPTGGMLVPRIVASGRACLRANDLTLCVQELPEGMENPFALVSVAARGPSDWEFLSVGRFRATLRVTIPLTVHVRDCAGCVHRCRSSITVDVPVRISIPQRYPGRTNVTVLPNVRLLCSTGCSDDGCFTVSLAVLVDVFVTRWEPSSDGITVPCRPDLPLTLPPHFNRCCR